MIQSADAIHPSDDSLRRFACGEMSGPPADTIEAHVETCAACSDRLRQQGHDSLQARLKSVMTPKDSLLLRCASCAQSLKVKRELAGKKVKCPKCGQTLSVPAEVAGGKPEVSLADAATLLPADAATAPPRDVAPPAASGVGGMQSAETEDERGFIEFLAPPQQPDEIGRLGMYRVLKVLGAGGMGVVFKAEDPKLERLVAIKAMLPNLAAAGASARKRFLREARAAAAVKHAHVVTIYQVDEDRDVPFLAMEFLLGEPLDERLKRDRILPLAETLRIGREMAEGLAAAHDLGLIHRDIKPANTWLEKVASGQWSVARKSSDQKPEAGGASLRATDHCPLTTDFHVKILDFGLARSTDDQQHLTQSGAIVGTPAYMSPEQGRGEELDARCDLWSLGVMLYRMCTGELPFKGKDTVSTLTAIALNQPKPPAEVNPDVPVELSKLVMKLLEKDPAKRIASAHEVAEALREIELSSRVQEKPGAKTTQGSRIRPTAPVGKPPHEGRRRRPALAKWIGLAFLPLFLLILCGWYIIRITHKDGTVTEIKVPDGTKAELIGPKGDKVTIVPPAEPKVDYDRKAVEILRPHVTSFVIRLVENGKELALTPSDPIPDQSFVVKKIQFGGLPKLPDDFTGKIFLPAVLPLASLESVWPNNPMPRLHLADDELLTLAWTPCAGTLGELGAIFELTQKSIDSLKRFPKLARIRCKANLAGDAELERLKELPSLQQLRLEHLGNSRKVTRKGCEAIASLPLTSLRLNPGSPFFDTKNVMVFASMPNLIYFQMQGPHITDNRLPDFSKFQGLLSLSLLRTSITDEGLMSLGAVKSLQKLELDGTDSVTAAGAKRLSDALPKCVIRLGGGKKIGPKDKSAPPPPPDDDPEHDADPDPTHPPNAAKEKTPPGPLTVSLVHKFQAAGNVALSGDGKYVLGGSPQKSKGTPTEWEASKTAILWDAASGQKIHTFEGQHSADIVRSTLSGDGKFALTGSTDKTAVLWDAATGKYLQTLKGHAADVINVALSDDGKRALTGSSDKTAILWDAAAGKKIHTFQCTGFVHGVALSGDGKFAVTGSWHPTAGTAILWDAVSGSKIQTFKGHTAGVSSVAVSGDGKRVLTGSWDRTAILWDAASGNKLQTFKGHADEVPWVALSRDGKNAFTASWDKTAIMWDTANGKKLYTFKGHTDKLWTVAVSDDGRYVLTGSGDKTAILWEIKTSPSPSPPLTGSMIQKFLGHTDQVRSVALSGDGKQVLTGSWDTTAILWDAASGNKIQTFRGHTDKVNGVALSGDGKRVLTGSHDRTAILWDANSGQKLQTFRGHSGPILSVALSGDGTRALTGSRDETAILWDAGSGAKLKTFVHSDSVRIAKALGFDVCSVALSGDARFVLTGSHTTSAWWDAASGKKLKTSPDVNVVSNVGLSGDGTKAVVGSRGKNITILWEPASGIQVHQFQGLSAAISGDGRTVATGGWVSGAFHNRDITVWDAVSGKKLETLQWPDGHISTLALSGDGRRLATGSDDGTVILWELTPRPPTITNSNGE